MALSDAEKTDVRRYCGYQVVGTAEMQLLTWPAYYSRGTLEFRMNTLSDAEETVLRRQLAHLLVLECAIPRAGENLDTDAAAMWTRNRSEQDDRLRLFDTWRRRLCQFLGVSAGPGLTANGCIAVVV